MNCAYKNREKAIDRIMAPIDHVKRRLRTDYHDAAGEDFNEEVAVWHNPEAGGDVLPFSRSFHCGAASSQRCGRCRRPRQGSA